MDNRIEDNFLTGYVRLYRSLANKGWYTKSEYVHLWLHILIKANHTGREFFFNGKNVKVSPGQFITGRKQLQIETGINESKIERILNFLEKNEHQIEQQKTTKNRLISVLNWDNYQNKKTGEHQNAQQLNNKRTTTEQQLNTNNNDKELNNEESFKKRKLKFSESLKEFLPLYGPETLNAFYAYWTEPNKSRTKFKQEMQKTWDTERRLKTWHDNDFNKNKNGQQKNKPTIGAGNHSDGRSEGGLQL